MAKSKKWLRSRKKTDAELPYEPPFWFGDYSNGELYHRATPKERKMREIILQQGAEQAKRHGMDRREFMASGLGVALSMSVMNLVNGCSGDSGGGGGLKPGTGGSPSDWSSSGGMPSGSVGTTPAVGVMPGGGSSGMMAGSGSSGAIAGGGSGGMMPAGGVGGGMAPSGMMPSDGGGMMSGAMTPNGGQMPDGGISSDPDLIECEAALDYSAMFIFDIQTHRVESVPGVYRSLLATLPQGACGLGVPGCYSREEYVRQMFLESDTTITVLSGVPAVDGSNPLTNEEIAQTRDFVQGIASDSQRVITHAMVLPNYNHERQIDAMSALVADYGPIGAWKCYTPWGPGDGVTGFWLDDPATGIPFIERGRELGVKVFCCHKGLPLPGFDNSFGDPKDIGVVAAAYPDTQFVVYHSAYQYGSPNENIPYTAGSKDGVNSLVTALRDNNIQPGSNVYAELGTTWNDVYRDPAAATHVLGKVLKYVGEDNVLWGTDCIWYGSPQPQIMALMSFTMDARIRDEEGYPDLTPQAKAKILGLNAARVFGVDPMATRCGIEAGAIAAYKRDLDDEFGKYRWALQRPVIASRREFFDHVRFHRAAKTPG